MPGIVLPSPNFRTKHLWRCIPPADLTPLITMPCRQFEVKCPNTPENSNILMNPWYRKSFGPPAPGALMNKKYLLSDFTLNTERDQSARFNFSTYGRHRFTMRIVIRRTGWSCYLKTHRGVATTSSSQSHTSTAEDGNSTGLDCSVYMVAIAKAWPVHTLHVVQCVGYKFHREGGV